MDPAKPEAVELATLGEEPPARRGGRARGRCQDSAPLQGVQVDLAYLSLQVGELLKIIKHPGYWHPF